MGTLFWRYNQNGIFDKYREILFESPMELTENEIESVRYINPSGRSEVKVYKN
jgi:hypothetical protein